ncbi:uncharacterized protein CEXT_547421 [Caerostris extrusa]|uniref:C2H2-type domain-containing protein n=1 Tax=Caerostris extrusa TaxID=172846 RepID=A0AAV4TC40_CAEEX|nr:uncharacterized protein CEXT_547421 [Caerostris extrusa]
MRTERFGFRFVLTVEIFYNTEFKMEKKTFDDEKTSLISSGKEGSRKTKKLLFSDSDSDSDDPFPEIECDLCSKSFSNVRAYEQHVSGKKHHQKLAQKRLMKSVGITENGDGEKDEEDASDELHCDVCQKTITGYISFAAHLKGSVHAKNVKRKKLKESLKDKPEVLAEKDTEVDPEDDGILGKPFARCPACDKTFYDPLSYKKHMVGQGHKKKILQQKTFDNLKHDDPELEDDSFRCEVCSKTFSGPIPYKTHLKSGVHENQVKRSKAMEKLKEFFDLDPENGSMVCKECKRTFTDPSAFKLHLDNKSHEKQSAKGRMLDFVSANPEIAAMKSVGNISSEDESDEEASYEKGYYFLVCKLCHTSFTGVESARDHVKCKKHQKAKKEKNDMKLLKKKLSEKPKSAKAKDISSRNGDEENKKPTMADEIDAALKNKEIPHSQANDDFELI